MNALPQKKTILDRESRISSEGSGMGTGPKEPRKGPDPKIIAPDTPQKATKPPESKRPAQGEKGRTAKIKAPDKPATAKAAPPPAEAKPEARSEKPVLPPVPQARIRSRHILSILSFGVIVILPVGISGWYLWDRAYDRYVSVAGFSVRTEEIGSAFDLLGGIASMAGTSSSPDTEILYSFIQSPEMVAAAQAKLDLRTLWSKADPIMDPVFAYHPPGAIEDLTKYWSRMVKVYSDSGSGLIDVEVQAFAPQDAHTIARFVYDESSSMINRLSDIARNDATRYAREELEQAELRLADAREALTRFRNRTQIVDPQASIQSQMGILSSLQAQLAQTFVDLDLLQQTTSQGDPRITQAERRVEAIEARIAEERRKLGIGTAMAGQDAPDSQAFADLVGEYERLIVEQEFAQQTYTSALASYNSALAEARRQSRYLAAHVAPTLPEASIYPQRVKLLGMVALFAFLTWAVTVLIGYSLRDRR